MVDEQITTKNESGKFRTVKVHFFNDEVLIFDALASCPIVVGETEEEAAARIETAILQRYQEIAPIAPLEFNRSGVIG